MTPEQAPLSTGQVARLFGVAPNTVRRWAEERRIPSFTTPSGQLRFRPDDINRMLADTQPAEAATA